MTTPSSPPALHVLHTLSSLEPRDGGPVVALHGLVRAQLQQGLTVTIVSTYQDPLDRSMVEALQHLGARVELVGPARGPLRGHPLLAARLDELIRVADVVHIHALWEEIQHRAAVVARRRGKPYIIRPCGMLDPSQLAQGGLKKKIYLALRLKRDLDLAAGLHFTCAEEARLTIPLGLKGPTIVEPNGVEMADFAALPSGADFDWHSHLGVPHEVPLLLFLGRIHAKKGFDVLVPALEGLADLPWHLLVAGPDEGGYQAVVSQMLAGRGLGERASFAGLIRGDQKLAALRQAHLFVLSSHHENFGNAVVEALAAGTPVVISDQVNIFREIRDAGVGGVAPLSAEAFGAELRRWLQDSAMHGRAVAAAPGFVAHNYDWKNIATRWTEHYLEMSKGRPPGVPSGA